MVLEELGLNASPGSPRRPRKVYGITDFLGTGVLDHQAAEIRHFLLATSIIDTLNAESRAAVTERSDADGQLARINQPRPHSDAGSVASACAAWCQPGEVVEGDVPDDFDDELRREFGGGIVQLRREPHSHLPGVLDDATPMSLPRSPMASVPLLVFVNGLAAT